MKTSSEVIYDYTLPPEIYDFQVLRILCQCYDLNICVTSQNSYVETESSV
jgi:hypothetical protein